MEPDESLIQTSFFLTAAVRSWLVNHLLDPQDIAEVCYLLVELGYQELPDSTDTINFLKSEMSRLNHQGSQNMQKLIRLCEGIVQFYLLRHPRKTPELDQFNSFLPPGFSFSSVTSRLMFEPEFFYQDHNLFLEEQAHWYLPYQNLEQVIEVNFGEREDFHAQDAMELKKKNKSEVPTRTQSARSSPLTSHEQMNMEISSESTSSKENRLKNPVKLSSEPSSRTQIFKSIRNQRLQLLKQWEQIP